MKDEDKPEPRSQLESDVEARPQKPKQEARLYFDGECPMCRSFNAGYEDDTLQRADLHQSELPDGISRAQAMAALHFVDDQGQIYRGAEAVLRLFARKGRFFGLPQLLLYQPLLFFAELVYRFIAKRRLLFFGPALRVNLIRYAAIIGCLVPMLVSMPLWLGDWQRIAPTTALFEWFPAANFPVDIICYVALLVLLLQALLAPRPSNFLFVFLPFFVLYSLGDLNRLMPYYIEFCWIFIILLQLPWPRERLSAELSSIALRVQALSALLLIGVYFWSGVHKLNITYLMHGFPWLMEPLSRHFNPSIQAQVYAFSIFTPLIEAAAAIALFFRTTRFWALIVLTAMHLLILALIGPFGHNYNPSVWSWNFVHITLLWLIFWRSSFGLSELLRPRSWLHIAVFGWFLVCPALVYVNLWPRTLANSLYTWSGMEAEVLVQSAENYHSLVDVLGVEAVPPGTPLRIDMKEWYYTELNSPPFDRESVYLSGFRSLCLLSTAPAELLLRIESRPGMIDGKRRRQHYRCADAYL